MSGLDLLWLVFGIMPVAFFIDLFVFTFAIWWVRRWRKARTQ